MRLQCKGCKRESIFIPRNGLSIVKLSNTAVIGKRILQLLSLWLEREEVPKTYETLTLYALAMMRVGSSPTSVSISATTSMNGSKATYFDPGVFIQICFKNAHCQAQLPFISIMNCNNFPQNEEKLWLTSHRHIRKILKTSQQVRWAKVFNTCSQKKRAGEARKLNLRHWQTNS